VSLTPPHWRWIILGALALFALLLFLVLLNRQRPEATSAGPSASASSSRGPRDMSLPGPSHPTPASTAAAETGVKDNLCGVSGSELLRKSGESIQQHVARLTDATMSRWRAALLASEDPRQQALGLALTDAQPTPNPSAYVAPDTSSNNSLVLLAIQSNDPAIYALALGQCGEQNLEMAVGPCQGLSVEHLAQIDSDNAMPWMWIASRAEMNGNFALADEALGHAANASRLQSYVGAMRVAALDVLPPDVTPLEKAMAGVDLQSIARIGSPFGGMLSLCSEEALQGAQRNEQCSSILNLLSTQGSTFLDVAEAAILSKRLGRPEDKNLELQNERDLYSHEANTSYPWNQMHAAQGFRCENLQRYDDFIDQLAAHGGNERAAMKATIEAQRKSIPIATPE